MNRALFPLGRSSSNPDRSDPIGRRQKPSEMPPTSVNPRKHANPAASSPSARTLFRTPPGTRKPSATAAKITAGEPVLSGVGRDTTRTNKRIETGESL